MTNKTKYLMKLNCSIGILSVLRIIIYIGCLFVILLIISGCLEEQRKEPRLIDGTHIMIIPEGTKVGKYKTPEEGIFIGKSRVIQMQMIPAPRPPQPPSPQLRVPEKQKEIRT